MKKPDYHSPVFREIVLCLEEGFASSIGSGIGDVTEENGAWD